MDLENTIDLARTTLINDESKVYKGGSWRGVIG
jgi:hypothetical protein